MSAYREQATNLNDGEILCEALKEVGFKEVQHHKEAVALEGYHGDKRKETAEIVVPRKVVGSASNDIGFKKDASGNYKAIISAYDSGRYNTQWLNKLKQVYSEKKVAKTARQNNLTFVKKTVVNGKVQMHYTTN